MRLERVRGEVGDFEREFRQLVVYHDMFDVRHAILDKVIELAREIRVEYLRKRRR